MIATVRCGTLVGLLVLCVACDAQQPTGPGSLPPTSPNPPAPPAPPSGPPLSGPSTTYHFSAPIDRAVRDYTQTSSYVLYSNGAFSLRYESPAGYMETGSYQQVDGRIIFDFGADGRGSPGGQPEAVGMLNGDLLEVRYSVEMRVFSDFEDAVYRRTE